MGPIMLMPDVAERLHTTVDTLRYWRHTGQGPKSFRIGRRVAYAAADVDAWLDEQARASAVGR